MVLPQSALDSFHTAVDQHLQQHVSIRADQSIKSAPQIADQIAVLSRFILGGGKRIRPAFVFTGWVCATGRIPELGDTDAKTSVSSLLDLAVAVELLQATALIHDDVIDRSERRRNALAVHAQLRDQHHGSHWHGDSSHWGNSLAILLGDLALNWSDDAYRQSAVSGNHLSRSSPHWESVRSEVLSGQILDALAEAQQQPSLEVAETINRLKTASYTVSRPLLLGASAANFDADHKLSSVLSEIGNSIGIAFQLRDDLLGAFGDSAVTGKPSGDDFREGKQTALIAQALHHAEHESPRSSTRIRELYGTSLSDSELGELRSLITDTGAVVEIEAQISQAEDHVTQNLENSVLPEQGRELLRQLCAYALKRDF